MDLNSKYRCKPFTLNDLLEILPRNVLNWVSTVMENVKNNFHVLRNRGLKEKSEIMEFKNLPSSNHGKQM